MQNTGQLQQLVSEAFRLIEEGGKLDDIEVFIQNHPRVKKAWTQKRGKYPEVRISITAAEIHELYESGVVVDGQIVASKISAADPLTKLLYALSWKQGDIKKINHVIRGILNSNNEDKDGNSGPVLFQFGRHLAQPHAEPIVDQHVIRAYSVWKANSAIEVEDAQRIAILGTEHSAAVRGYRLWFQGIVSKKNQLMGAVIDDLVFAVGKSIKPNGLR